MTNLLPTRVRSWLFTPATRPERFVNAAEAGADVLLIDLEDAVAPRDKSAARTTALDFWPAPARVRSGPCVSTDLIRGLASPISMRCSDQLHLQTSWSCPRRKLAAICKSSTAF